MISGRAEQLGRFLKAQREARGLSTHRLAAAAGMDQATVVRFEAGSIAAPRPDKLARLAEALGVSGADLFALAGYSAPSDLPALRPYLSARYPDLPPEDIEKIATYVARLAKKRGVSLTSELAADEPQEDSKARKGGES